jgi:hypothetical protein
MEKDTGQITMWATYSPEIFGRGHDSNDIDDKCGKVEWAVEWSESAVQSGCGKAMLHTRPSTITASSRPPPYPYLPHATNWMRHECERFQERTTMGHFFARR